MDRDVKTHKAEAIYYLGLLESLLILGLAVSGAWKVLDMLKNNSQTSYVSAF